SKRYVEEFESTRNAIEAKRVDWGDCEQELDGLRASLAGFDDEALRNKESARAACRQEEKKAWQDLSNHRRNLDIAERELKAANSKIDQFGGLQKESQIFVRRAKKAQDLANFIEERLKLEEAEARSKIEDSIHRVLDATSTKGLRAKLLDDYTLHLFQGDDFSAPKPRSSGENQILGLAFTAALVEFAKTRSKDDDRSLLRGTIAPMFLDAPFGQLNKENQQVTARHLPKMASQVILLVSNSQL
ncbi:MAG: hypothetical protein CFE32_22160, partial [Alphaproteobacteria bacterium PA3]